MIPLQGWYVPWSWFFLALTFHLPQVIDEDRDGSEGGDGSSTSAGLSCPGIRLLPGADVAHPGLVGDLRPVDLPDQPSDVCAH